jgi:hypothetical protein
VSNAALSRVWATTCGSVAAKAVLACLADHLNSETGRCDPSVSTLATECDLSERAVQTNLRKLETDGHLTVHRVSGRRHSFSIHPRTAFAPEASAPPKEGSLFPEASAPLPRTAFTPTPEASAPKPEGNQKMNQKLNQKRARPRPSVEEILRDIPSPHGTERCAALWGKWVAQRLGKNKAEWSALFGEQRAKLSTMIEPDAVAVLEYSVFNAYTGLFFDRIKATANGRTPTGNGRSYAGWKETTTR